MLKSWETVQRNIMHNKEFAGNQGNHQNCVLNMHSKQFCLVFIRLSLGFTFMALKGVIGLDAS